MGYWILWDIEPRVGTDLDTLTDVSEGSDPPSTEETRRSVLEQGLLDGLDVSVKKVQPEHNPADQFSKATQTVTLETKTRQFRLLRRGLVRLRALAGRLVPVMAMVKAPQRAWSSSLSKRLRRPWAREKVEAPVLVNRNWPWGPINDYYWDLSTIKDTLVDGLI